MRDPHAVFPGRPQLAPPQRPLPASPEQPQPIPLEQPQPASPDGSPPVPPGQAQPVSPERLQPVPPMRPGAPPHSPGAIPPPRPPQPGIRWILAWGIEACILIPLVLLFARSIADPLRRLAATGQAGGQPGAGTSPLPPEGPAEVRAAIAGFNAVQGRLSRLVHERTQMVGAIAHDLRTPLTRLAFRLDDLPPALGDKVRADIDEMKSMIAAALDFIKERSVTGEIERLDFRSLVETVVDEHADLGHDVVLEPGSPLPLEGVPLALRRMVGNLVDNALKYGRRARLRLLARDGYAQLQIEDDGPGIPESLQSQVFDPFFRIEGSRGRQTGGTGLGLTAVRAILTEHGGEVRLANRKEGGLAVTVLLPLPRAV